MSGRVIHFEVPADDTERAKQFYTDAFGWQIQSMPDLGYHLVSTCETDEKGMPRDPGSINGGMFEREGELDRPIITIHVDDMAQALARVESLGGSTVRGKEPVADMGFAAYFKDSEGNLMGMWQDA